MGVTGKDLYKSIQTFVFNEAQINGKAAIIPFSGVLVGHHRPGRSSWDASLSSACTNWDTLSV